MRRIYIAGCGGMLGEAFHETFSDGYDVRCTDIDLNAPWLSYLDFRDYDAYRADVTAFQPDCLFHLGAHTDLEYCERNPDDAYATNTMAVENAVYIANALDVPLFYVSTAGIFDGQQLEYDDWDEPRPLGIYARSKHAGERFVVEHARRHLICRAGWMMGGGPRKDKKFIQKLMAQIAEGRSQLHIVDDKQGTPTYTYDFARNTRALIERELWGLYNMVCGGQTNRLEVAREVIDILGLRDTVAIVPVSSEHFKTQYFAPRPPSERLVNRKLDLRGLNMMRDWRETLREYLARDYASFVPAPGVSSSER